MPITKAKCKQTENAKFKHITSNKHCDFLNV